METQTFLSSNYSELMSFVIGYTATQDPLQKLIAVLSSFYLTFLLSLIQYFLKCSGRSAVIV